MNWRPRFRGGAAAGLRFSSPPMIRQEIDATPLLPGDPTQISHAGAMRGWTAAGPLHAARQAIRSPNQRPYAFPPPLLDELAADLAAQITWHRHLAALARDAATNEKPSAPEAATRPASTARPPGSRL